MRSEATERFESIPYNMSEELKPATAISNRSFASLLEVHEALDEMFLEHQEALLRLDLRLAEKRLREFERSLVKHMTDEEELLLPIYRRAGKIAGGAEELFTGEHRRMKDFISRFFEKLKDISEGTTGLKRKVIALLDDEAMFKLLMEHHDSRERVILYPTLDSVSTREEREGLIAECLGPLDS